MPTTWTSEIKPGGGWTYNSPFISYSGTIDSLQSLPIFYNTLGELTAWTALSK